MFSLWGRGGRACTVRFVQVRHANVKADKPPPVMLAHSYKPGMNIAGWYCSEKLDGIRAYWNGSKLQTRNGVFIDVPKTFKRAMQHCFPKMHADGELFVKPDFFQQTMGAVMRSKEKEGMERWEVGPGVHVSYYVFDLPPRNLKDRSRTYAERLALLQSCQYTISMAQLQPNKFPGVKYLATVESKRLGAAPDKAKEQADKLMQRVLRGGGEGLMLREPNSLYTGSRSHTLLKMKEVEESEALVLDWAEGVGKYHGLVGALRCRLHNGIHFEVGTGLPDSCRLSPDDFIGKVITVRHQSVTDLGVPRFPTYIGTRLDRSPSEFTLLSDAIAAMAEA
eukprot:TRINITY_DN2081_c1_g1_i1.p1 TRINITY_DN2081_c1_g1~~TRINITY_DN2081_c1_g1_i1.p1  ORF type:complete len:336 (+),score=84.52 TRINITY_DN2081_c1_g1_i1:57-1064(+)